MNIAPGLKLGSYKIIALLGKGGMGEVWRAQDTRLDRAVAIKALPAMLATDADRLRRFALEAKATGTLNHPNILTVHDIGTHEDAPYIVAELLEGEELRAQLNHGALPLRRSVEYAQQIAAGLAAAHEKGIVHRDLKPENLFITKDDRVKILDFGLAKLTGMRNEEAATLIQGEAPNPQPPIRNPQLTAPGTVMGTVAYMSPEQVRGQEVEQRSDIFSFGLILYEMLAGRRAFQKASFAETMAAIANEEAPDLCELNSKVTPQLDKIVRRCLEKKPERRFQTASDLGFALETLAPPGSAGVSPATSAGTAARSPHEEIALSSGNSFTRWFASLRSQTAGETPALPGRWRERFAWIAAGVLALALLALGVAYFRRPALEAESVRLSLMPPEKATRFDYPTISPDGRTLAFAATVEGKTQLWVRPLGSTTAKPLTEMANTNVFPFWSPDSQFIAYFDDGKLKKIALAGGKPEALCNVRIIGGGTWNPEGVILFGARTEGIKRTLANGGEATTITQIDSAGGELFHNAPVFLPDGRHFLFFKANRESSKTGIYLASLDGGEVKLLLPTDQSHVGIVIHPAIRNQGYLVFVRQEELLAQPLDFSRYQLTGEPVRLVEKVQRLSAYSRFSVATNGVLVLIEGESNRSNQLTWVDRAGKKLGTVGSIGNYRFMDLSPDEKHLAFGRSELQAQTFDIRLFDLTRGTESRFTSDPADDSGPLWSPDGSRIVWYSNREGIFNLFQKAANGAGQDELLLKPIYSAIPLDWSADGQFILYRELNPQTNLDLWVLPLAGERRPWPWLVTQFVEGVAKFSPDSKWIAYSSNESGRNEIYLQAFVPGAPASGGKVPISTTGGTYPQWRRDGRELYYISADNKLMAVDITLGTQVKVGTPKELFSLSDIRVSSSVLNGYTKTGDGQRFLFVTSAEETSVPPFTVVLNWMAEMKK